MDNIAHTLVGAALGRAFADTKVPAPAILGAVAANAPDWTELFMGMKRTSASYLSQHRGITHSFLGAGVEIAVFTLMVGGFLAWRSRRGEGGAPPRWGWILALFAATVGSHLFMDWLGSYGLRPYLPWSGQRFYADWVAIVDPFFWIVPLVALAWGETRRWPIALGWTLLLIPLLVLVLIYRDVAPWVRLTSVGLALLGVVGWHGHWFGPGERRAAVRLALIILAIYTAAQAAVATVVQHRLQQTAELRFGPRATSAALTRVGHPFRWEPVIAGPDTVAGPGWSIPRHLDLPDVRRALATSDGQAHAGFARFLTAEVDSVGPTRTVYLRDARYARSGRRGWAIVEVPLH
jgi:membrane-bound metal-dependent hydrolase YbcI (DUF457 family)